MSKLSGKTAIITGAAYVEENNVFVARRLSGGGAVYHDEGNLNYAIIMKKQENNLYDFASLSQPVVDALNELGVDARQSGRNDLTIDGKKFSGAAQYSSQNRLLHHGTLLFNSDLSRLVKALKVKPLKIESKGVKSVKSRVTTISDYLVNKITLEDFKLRILDHLLQDQKCTEYHLTEEDISVVEKKVKEKFSTWAWNWGESPNYSMQRVQKLACGIVDLRLGITGGSISGLQIFGDFFSLKDISGLIKALVGTEYRKEALSDAIKWINVGDYINGLTNGEFLLLLIDSCSSKEYSNRTLIDVHD